MPSLKPEVKLKHSVHLRVDFDTFEVLKSHALKQGRSLSSVVNEVLAAAARVIGEKG